MTGFTDVFGGSTLQAAQVAYRAVALATSAVLKWPPYATADNYLARIMDVTPSVAALTLTLPDATLASKGQDAFFNNKGANSFTLLDSAGGVVAVIAPGAIRYVYLIDNSTAAGTWVSILMGVGSSTLDASQLAGQGLKAINNTLAQAAQVNSVSGSTALTTSVRATVLIWEGGTGTLTLPALVTAGSDWFFEVRNQGSGVLTLAPVGGELIDDAANIQLQLNESCFVHAGPSEWYTVGRGRNAQFNFTLLTKTVDGGTDVLSLTEAANVVQSYIGTLLGNQSIVLPAVVQVYYVSNNTTGAFSLTFRNPSTGTTVSVPTGQSAILFSDGVNVINASTTLSGLTNLNLAAGSAASPSLSINTTNTGFYSSGTNQIGVSANGTQVGQFDTTGFRTVSTGTTSNQSVSSGGTAQVIVDRPAGQIGRVGWRTAGLNRWSFDANITAETGANAGSDFAVSAYDDAGALLGTAFTIARASRVVSFTIAPSGPGGAFVDLNSVQTLTNKSLTNPIITGSTGTAALNTLSLLTPLPLTSGGTGSTTAANARTNLGVPDAIQTQQYTAFTTAGTSTAYTVVTTPAQAALAANQEYELVWHTASGANPTLARDGLAAKNIKIYDGSGNKVAPPAGSLVTRSIVVYDGTDYVVLNPLPTIPDELVNPQTGVNYAYLTGDKGKDVTRSNAAAMADTIPQAGSTGFANGWWTSVTNVGGTQLTITPTTSTIEGRASLILGPGQGAKIISDGTNYTIIRTGSSILLGSVATTSGTSQTVSIPSGFKKLELYFGRIGFTAANRMQLRVGPVGGLAVAGYIQQFNNLTNAGGVGGGQPSAEWTVGQQSSSGAELQAGTVTIAAADAANNIYSVSGTGNGLSGGIGSSFPIAGSVALAGTMTQFSIFGGTFNTGALTWMAWY